jgi:hypothetical protein
MEDEYLDEFPNRIAMTGKTEVVQSANQIRRKIPKGERLSDDLFITDMQTRDVDEPHFTSPPTGRLHCQPARAFNSDRVFNSIDSDASEEIITA